MRDFIPEKPRPWSVHKTLAFLILTLIVAFIVCYELDGALAIDEVIDDYTDTSMVNISVEMVHNSTYNVMELNYTSGYLLNPPMDIWTTGGFTEVDDGADHLKNVNGTQIKFDDVDRDEGDRIYKDFGANYFTGDWEYHFRVYISSSHTDNARCIFMMFSETNEDQTDMVTNDRDFIELFIQWKTVGTEWEVYLRSWDEGVATSDGEAESGALDLNKWYHVTYIRDGDNVTAWFYNNKAKTSLDFMLTVVDADVTDLRYFHPLNSQDQATGGRAMDLFLNWVRNATSGWSYEPTGYFTTTNLMSGLTENVTVVLLNTSIPAGSINLEWSPDGSAWTDLGPLPNNTGCDDLRGFASQIGIFRFNFTRGGPQITPRLYQTRLIYENGAITAPVDVNIYYALAIILLLIGLMIGSRLR